MKSHALRRKGVVGGQGIGYALKWRTTLRVLVCGLRFAGRGLALKSAQGYRVNNPDARARMNRIVRKTPVRQTLKRSPTTGGLA
jgi:hypothetical protein